jgi:hypothetical protein
MCIARKLGTRYQSVLGMDRDDACKQAMSKCAGGLGQWFGEEGAGRQDLGYVPKKRMIKATRLNGCCGNVLPERASRCFSRLSGSRWSCTSTLASATVRLRRPGWSRQAAHVLQQVLRSMYGVRRTCTSSTAPGLHGLASPFASASAVMDVEGTNRPQPSALSRLVSAQAIPTVGTLYRTAHT